MARFNNGKARPEERIAHAEQFGGKISPELPTPLTKVTLKVKAQTEIPDQIFDQIGESIRNLIREAYLAQQSKDGNCGRTLRKTQKKKSKTFQYDMFLAFQPECPSPRSRIHLNDDND